MVGTCVCLFVSEGLKYTKCLLLLNFPFDMCIIYHFQVNHFSLFLKTLIVVIFFLFAYVGWQGN